MERNQKAGEDGLEEEASFGSGGNNGKHIDNRIVTVSWGTLWRKEVDWRNHQGITICISERQLTRHVQLKLESQ